ncbi:MAG: hypothetical protein N3F04_00815 [Candidatus Nezhaarchaeota archaeon]|nr:hypothetical protein [Candidatus Nezhaarchaeota archaeon]MCX8141317.1 hypothetical protein [Candidatus Nezhaarchaeota archaeon]MDW8049583.1 hypothetical protein [Nitrososphaerota archaeon]
MPRAFSIKRLPIAPNKIFEELKEHNYLYEEELEELIQLAASSQGFEVLVSFIGSLISTIEHQEVMLRSLTKLLEEKGLITRDELLKKVEEINKERALRDEDLE